MTNNSQEYIDYTVTIPITLFVQSTNPQKAVDLAIEAILNPANFNLLKNADIDITMAKVEQGHRFVVESNC